MADYVTPSDVKSALGMASSDVTRDGLITKAISASSRLIDRETGRSFGLDEAASPRVFIPANDELLIVDDIGSLSDLVVEGGVQGVNVWVPITDYEVSPLNAIAKRQAVTGLVRAGGFGSTSRARMRVTARWGWPAVPDEVVQATLIQAVRLFKRKDSAEGILGNAEWGFARVSRVDPDVQALIAHLMLPGF